MITERMLKKYENMTVAELKAAYEKINNNMEKEIEQLAAIVRALDKKGEDLRWIPLNLRKALLNIANGKISPKAFDVFKVLPVSKWIYNLPIKTQERLATGAKKIEVYEEKEGKSVIKAYDPVSFPTYKSKQVFSEDGIRNINEQKEWLDKNNNKTEDKKVEVQKDNKKVVITKGKISITITLSEMEKWINELKEGKKSWFDKLVKAT